jgi:hypothetical protein
VIFNLFSAKSDWDGIRGNPSFRFRHILGDVEATNDLCRQNEGNNLTRKLQY